MLGLGSAPNWKVGDRTIYRVQKCSTRPGPRAINVHAATAGENYTYEVDKFWIVTRVEQDRIVVQTRTGKIRTLAPNDQRLRRASLLERILFADRFPDPGDVQSSPT